MIAQHFFTHCEHGLESEQPAFQTRAQSAGFAPDFAAAARCFYDHYDLPASLGRLDAQRTVSDSDLARAPVAVHYYAIDDRHAAVTRSVLSRRQTGRGGNYAAHTVVFPREQLAEVDGNPFEIARRMPAMLAGSFPAELEDLPTFAGRGTERKRTKRRGERAGRDEAERLLGWMRDQAASGRPIVIVRSDPADLNRLLEDVLLLLPPEARGRVELSSYDLDPRRLVSERSGLRLLGTLPASQGGRLRVDDSAYEHSYYIDDGNSRRHSAPPAISAGSFAAHAARAHADHAGKRLASVHRFLRNLGIAGEIASWDAWTGAELLIDPRQRGHWTDDEVVRTSAGLQNATSAPAPAGRAFVLLARGLRELRARTSAPAFATLVRLCATLYTQSRRSSAVLNAARAALVAATAEAIAAGTRDHETERPNARLATDMAAFRVLMDAFHLEDRQQILGEAWRRVLRRWKTDPPSVAAEIHANDDLLLLAVEGVLVPDDDDPDADDDDPGSSRRVLQRYFERTGQWSLFQRLLQDNVPGLSPRRPAKPAERAQRARVAALTRPSGRRLLLVEKPLCWWRRSTRLAWTALSSFARSGRRFLRREATAACLMVLYILLLGVGFTYLQPFLGRFHVHGTMPSLVLGLCVGIAIMFPATTAPSVRRAYGDVAAAVAMPVLSAIVLAFAAVLTVSTAVLFVLSSFLLPLALVGTALAVVVRWWEARNGARLQCVVGECESSDGRFADLAIRYHCPGGCGAVYDFLAPGRHGLLFHSCSCGGRLPALARLRRRRRANGTSWEASVAKECPLGHPWAIGTRALDTDFVALAGGVGTGKTCLVTTAVDSLRARPVGAGCWIDTIDHGGPVLGKAIEDLEEGIVPARSQPTVPDAIVLRTVDSAGERRLYLYDPSGETYGGHSNWNRNEYRFFRDLTGVLLVVDPLGLPGRPPIGAAEREAYHVSSMPFATVVRELLDYVRTFRERAQSSLPIRLGVVLSKADAPWVEDELGAMPSVLLADDGPACRRLLREWGATEEVDRLEDAFSEVRYFRSSALGSNPGGASFFARGVDAPIDWLHERRGSRSRPRRRVASTAG